VQVLGVAPPKKKKSRYLREIFMGLVAPQETAGTLTIAFTGFYANIGKQKNRLDTSWTLFLFFLVLSCPVVFQGIADKSAL
jgi:hypothetical protein